MIDIYEQMNIEKNAYDSGYESAEFLYEEQIAQLTFQRDILLAALKAIEEGCSFPDDEVQKAVRDRARAAIAKAEGKE